MNPNLGNLDTLPNEIILNSPISVGLDHYGIIDNQGRLYMAGKNKYGQIGNGQSKIPVEIPVHIPFNSKVISISCGRKYTGSVTMDGKVYLWGNRYYMLQKSEFTNAEIDKVTLPEEIQLSAKSKAVKIICDYQSYIIIFENGQVYYKYHNDFNMIIEGRIHIKNEIIVHVDSAVPEFYLLTKTGKVYIHKTDSDEQIKKVDFPYKIRNFSAGFSYILTVLGEVYKHRYDSELQEYEKINFPEKIVFISTKDNVNIAVSRNGKLYMWGLNKGERIIKREKTYDLPEETVDILASIEYSAEVILNPIEISIGKKVKYVDSDRFSMAVTEDGTISQWGNIP